MTEGAAISAIKNVASVTNLIANLIMRASCFPRRGLQPPLLTPHGSGHSLDIRRAKDDRDGQRRFRPAPGLSL
jgi:hypothetical protein